MTEDELIREIQLKNQLSGLDRTPVPEYDPSDGTETVEELKKYVRFLYASLQEKDEENLQIRKEMFEIKEELKAANHRADEEATGRKRFFYKLEIFMDSQKFSSSRDFFVDYVRVGNQGRRDFGRSSLTRLLPKGRKNLIRLAFVPRRIIKQVKF